MQIMEYDSMITFRPEVPNRLEYFRLGSKLLDKIMPKLNEKPQILKYMLEDRCADSNLMRQFFPTLIAAEGDVSGKKILDLGCGSRNYYFPILPYALSELGADVIGIDKDKDVLLEDFKAYNLDLVKDSLDFIPDSSIDIALANALFHCPTTKTPIMKFYKKVKGEMERIVKPEGKFVYDAAALWN